MKTGPVELEQSAVELSRTELATLVSKQLAGHSGINSTGSTDVGHVDVSLSDRPPVL